MPLPHINVIGSGKLGRTLVRLFVDQKLAQPGDFFNRNATHSAAAVKFCGGGQSSQSLAEMGSAELWLLATPDDTIGEVACSLAACRHDWAQTIVFHASGLHSSTLLEPLKNRGAAVASAHPVHSFANPEQSLTSYHGTVCTIEGDPLATERLSELFSNIGSTVIPLSAAGKAVYHAATVMASNYLVALQQISQDMLAHAGMGAIDTLQILQPLMDQSLLNIRKNGSVNALTGPVSRGDIQTLTKHIDAIAREIPQYLPAYKELGKVAVRIAREQQQLGESRLNEMAALFSS